MTFRRRSELTRWSFSRARNRRAFRGDQKAASEVVGTILLVAITVVMAAGFAFMLGTFTQPVNRAHADLDVTINFGEDEVWGTGDEEIIIRHLGGEPLDRDLTSINIRIGSASQELTKDELGSIFDDMFRIGETFLFVTDSAPFSGITTGQAVDVVVASSQGGSSLVAALSVNAGGILVPGGFQLTYPSSIPNPTVGTLDDGDPIMDGDDAGAVGKYDEVAVPTTTTIKREPTNGPANSLSSDNVRSVLPSSPSTVVVSGWGSAISGDISSVTAFIEWRWVANGSGGQTNDDLRFSHVAGTATRDLVYDDHAGNPDSIHSLTLAEPAGGWDSASVAAIELQAEYVVDNAVDKRDFEVDVMWIEVGVDSTPFRLEGQFVFGNPVPNGNQWSVEVAYLADDSFRVEAKVGSSWEACGTLLPAASLTPASCPLTSAQYNGGNPTLRVVDTGGTPATQNSISFDYVRVRTT